MYAYILYKAYVITKSNIKSLNNKYIFIVYNEKHCDLTFHVFVYRSYYKW